jgi:hypothetical protein
MRTTHCLLTLSTGIALTGCVTAHTTMLSPNRYAPVPASDVHLYLEPEEVPAECERIALIHASGDVNLTNERRMIAAARKRAGKAGANAVAIRSMRDPGLGTRVAAEVFDLPADRKGELLAFRCPGPSDATGGD